MDIWNWICELPNSDEWVKPNSPPAFFQLASSKTSQSSTQSIQFKAEKIITTIPNTDVLVTFTVLLNGFQSSHTSQESIIWVSNTCSLSSDKPFLPLVLQLIQEIISHSPTAQDSTCPRVQLQNIKPDPIIWIMASHSPESFSSFFYLVFLTHLFWLCVSDGSSDVGLFYFRHLLAPNFEKDLLGNNNYVLRKFLITVGVDIELCFMRTIGYMLAKSYILREVGLGLQSSTPQSGWSNSIMGFSYAMEAHGFWTLKGYAPIPTMKVTRSKALQNSKTFPMMEAGDSVLKYALAHQQLEAVIQFEYSVGFYDGYIQVNARVDNLRFHVAKLGYTNNKIDDIDFGTERYFPSRMRVWVGPEVGATYVAGLSLGRSTDNSEKEVKVQETMKGSFGKSKVQNMKAAVRTSTSTRRKNWKWDQDAEGNTAVFDAILCDNTTGEEVATSKSFSRCEKNDFMKRVKGDNRPFIKNGSLVMAGDQYGEDVGWRLTREMEGSVLKWRIGGKIWISYWPNEVKSSYFDTRCVEWCDEVDLPLIPTKFSF